MDRILISDSLQETLWRLEEVRYGFRSKSDASISEALDWVLSRQGLPTAYRNRFFAPTERDFQQGLRLPTGEQIRTRAALMHILGEEALRATIIWGRRSSSTVKEALQGFDQIHEAAHSNGRYCCYNCTIAFLRTLTVVKPTDWNKTLTNGLSEIRKARTDNGRWKGYPFYYTLLMLSELKLPNAHDELKHARKAAEKLLSKYEGNDRTTRFRHAALTATTKKL
jgi:hypothetical protein